VCVPKKTNDLHAVDEARNPTCTTVRIRPSPQSKKGTLKGVLTTH